MKSFLFRVVRTVGLLLIGCLLGGLFLLGVVLTSSSFFFEETRSQLTMPIVLVHIGMLLAGLTCFAFGIVGAKLAVSRWSES